LFTGKSLIEPAKILFTISLGMAIISLSNLVLFYKLSKGRTSGYYLTLVLIGVEAALLFTFSSNLVQFSQAFLSSSVIFLIGSFLLSKR
jgi:hypothetical protein